MSSTQHPHQQLRGGNTTTSGSGSSDGCIDVIGADLIHNVLSRLPASSFAAAACVNRSWNSICSRILSSPKLSSAISLNPSLEGAVDEVVEKVLSKPTRPHFVIASIGPSFCFTRTHRLITGRFGSSIPVITSLGDGIIGRDALTNQLKEVQWEVLEVDEDLDGEGEFLPNKGIVLTVGYLPGLKATLIPLLSQGEALMIDEFVMDIKKYSFPATDMAPSMMILFSDLKTDMRPVLQKLDFAFPLETVVVGEAGGRHRYRSDWDTTITRRQQEYNPAAVALVFIRDRYKPPGIGEIQFHAMLSAGLRSVGPIYKAVSVRDNKNECSTWLTAKINGTHENLDGQSILQHTYNEIGDRIERSALYIGVTKRRRCSIRLEKARLVTFLEFHEVMGGDEEYLYVNDIGIRTGDSFRFYASDSNTALGSRNNVYDYFRRLKHSCEDTSNQQSRSTSSGKKMSIFGGLMFACCGRGESFFACPNVDSTPFLESFPAVNLGGTFCSGEIVLAEKSIYGQEYQDEGAGRCSLHFFSTVYLVLSYIPAEF